MKKTRKILFAILVISLIASCFAIASSAYVASDENYEDVLEFYEKDVYVSEDFSDANNFTGYDDSFSVSGSFSNSRVDTNNGTFITKNYGAVYLDMIPSQAPESFGFNTSFSFSDEYGQLAIMLNSTNRSESANCAVSLMKIVAQGGEQKFMAASGECTYSSTLYTTFPAQDTAIVLEADKFYSIEIFCTQANNTLTGTMRIYSDETTTPLDKTYTFTVNGFSMGTMSLVYNANYSDVALDYIEAYEGSFARRTTDNAAVVGDYIKQLVALYETEMASQTPDAEYARDLLETVCTVVADYGYTTDGLAAGEAALIDAAIKKACTYLGATYADEYVAGAAEISSAAHYAQRLELAESLRETYESLLTYIAENYPGDLMPTINTQSRVTNAMAAVNTELNLLATYKTKTLEFLTRIAPVGDVVSMNYAELKAAYTAVADTEPFRTYSDENYTQEFVASQISKANTVISRYESLTRQAKNFIDGVIILSDTTKNFGERYEAYVLAETNYFDDATYVPYKTYATLADAIAAYNGSAAVVREAKEYADLFDRHVSDAKNTNSYAVREESLGYAAMYVNIVQESYPGVPENKELYRSLVRNVKNKKEAATAYINAVIAIESKTTLADKKAAVEAARALQANGDDVSVLVSVDHGNTKVTVAMANVMFSDADMEIKVYDKNISNYVESVAAIAGAKNLADRKAAIVKAAGYKAAADVNGEGVAAATATLEAAIAQYNSDVVAINTAVKESGSVVATVTGKTAPSGKVQAIVAIVKKIYE